MECPLEVWVRCSWSWEPYVPWRCFPRKGTASARMAWADKCAGCCSAGVWDVAWLCKDAGREQSDATVAG